MVVRFAPTFQRSAIRLRRGPMREGLAKLLQKIIIDPGVGKPMRFGRKGTREVRLGSYRISYSVEEDTMTFLDVHHKDEQ